MKSAIEKVMDYLARRDHSPQELMTKLKANYTPLEIEDAIQYAISHGWILKSEDLAQKVASRLDEKMRGILYINKYLNSKGLPAVSPQWDREFEKGRELVGRRWKEGPYTYEEKQAIYRYLIYRGFTDDICKKIIYEK